MNLSNEQVRDLIKIPTNKDILSKAEVHEWRLRLHSQTELIAGDIKNPYYKDLIAWVKSFLPADKHEKFTQLLRPPFVTSDLMETVMSEFIRIFETQNRFVKYEFTNPEALQDFNEYLETDVKDQQFWETKGYEALRKSINSVLIVDLPSEQDSDNPEPFYYLLDISKVIDMKVDDDNVVHHIAFWLVQDERFAFYDSERYRVFEKVKIDGGKADFSLVVDNPHDLGYCPARSFYTDNLTITNQIQKQGPATNTLHTLDWLLVFGVFKNYLDLYAPFPIYSAYEESCSYREIDINSSSCEGGYITYDEYYNDADGKSQSKSLSKRCPKCAASSNIGPGSFKIVPAPDEDGVDMKNPVAVLPAEITSLEFCVEEIERLEEDIFFNIAGIRRTDGSNQARNEKDVQSAYESRKNALTRVKKNFEAIHKFGNDTIARLRYGSSFIGSTINYGTEFYLLALNDLHAEFKLAKENGAPEEELENIYNQIIETKYKGNPEMISKMRLLSNINPLSFRTDSEAISLLEKGLISQEDLKIKINFNRFVKRFERENGNILEFGALIDYSKRVDNIFEQFKKYANEQASIEKITE